MSEGSRVSSLRELIPHSGAMCLLDSIVEWNAERIECSSRTHTAADNPLRSHGSLSSIHLIEYAAQAMAAHGALIAKSETASAQPRPGMLAAIRNVRLQVADLDSVKEALAVSARRRMAQPDGLIYDFEVRSGERTLAEGRLVIALG